MTRGTRLFYTIIAGYCCLLCGVAAGAAEREPLYSASTADLLMQQATWIYRQDPLDSQNTEQAMTFLAGALALNPGSDAVDEQILRIGSANTMAATDYSDIIMQALGDQVRVQQDLQVLTEGVRYLLEQKNSRLDREVLLEQLLRQYAGLNKAFASELATQLGLLAVEKADMENALNWLAYAHELNPYNQLAFEKLREVSSLQELAVKPDIYLVQLRQGMDLDPYDLNRALQYADALNTMQAYELAMPAYEYAAQLYGFLYPEKPLDEGILLSWALAGYHASRQESRCLRIIEQYRDPDRFDLMLESVAGKAAMKLGQVEKAETILRAAGQKAEKLLSTQGLGNPINPEQLAWFYSFVFRQPEKALAWANRAFKEAPQREGVEPIFAYALAQSGQMELAGDYAKPHQQDSQIASLVMAMAAFDEGLPADGLEGLKATVAMVPESFVAEQARQLLKSHGSEYIVPASVASAQAALMQAYEKRVVPEFLAPDKRFAATLFFSGSDFFYGIDFEPKLSLKNTSTGPLVIGPGSYLQGALRVDAVISGDLNVDIPNLLRMRFRPSRPVLPGEHVSVSLPLDTGKLRTLLLTYPQADVDVTFIVYLDPIEQEGGAVENYLPATKPIRQQIHRSGVVLTRDFLIQRLDALAKGQQGQQLRAVTLFTGLLAEQKLFSTGGVLFEYVQVDRSLLTDAVRRGLRDEDWKVRIQVLHSLLSLQGSLEPILIQDISANLSHPQWPVRMMAMALLARDQQESFQQVLQWTAEQDGYALNRRMAEALIGGERGR